MFKLNKKYISIIVISFLTFGFLTKAKPVFASTVYTYKDSKGHIFITNRASKGKGLRLVKKLVFKPFRDRASVVYTPSPYFDKARTSKYDTLISRLSKRYSVDKALIKAVVHIESAFQREAVSRVGAMGLMQLMPKTAASYNLTENHFEPEANLTAGIRHLKYLLKRYKGDKELSLAAYNAGETAVAKHNGIPPYTETQNYVVKVLNLYDQYSDSFKG